MLRSMTGYGASLKENDDFVQTWEIRSVNGRYLDIKWRLPVAARSLEADLTKLVRGQCSRGRIDISLQLRRQPDARVHANFDEPQARAMLESIERFAASRGDSCRLDYGLLLQIQSLWSEPDGCGAGDLASDLAIGLEQAIADWNSSRETEGQALADDLLRRIDRLGGWLATLRENAPAIRQERCSAMRQRIAEMLDAGALALDESRFQQEIAILADRLDVSEELTRLAAHMKRLRALVENGGEAGKRLDFTLQECFREINTFGNKLPDAALSPLVVDFKNELEKCREQVQNLE